MRSRKHFAESCFLPFLLHEKKNLVTRQAVLWVHNGVSTLYYLQGAALKEPQMSVSTNARYFEEEEDKVQASFVPLTVFMRGQMRDFSRQRFSLLASKTASTSLAPTALLLMGRCVPAWLHQLGRSSLRFFLLSPDLHFSMPSFFFLSFVRCGNLQLIQPDSCFLKVASQVAHLWKFCVLFL